LSRNGEGRRLYNTYKETGCLRESDTAGAWENNPVQAMLKGTRWLRNLADKLE